MAGSGPVPKHPSERRRRNAVAGIRTLPSEGSGLEAPPLPVELELSEWGRNYWIGLWESPMAVAWEPMDIPALIRLAVLQDAAISGTGSGAGLVEIRNLEDRFGLSPMARKRLQWEIAQAAPAARETGSTRAAPRASSGSRRRLRAV